MAIWKPYRWFPWVAIFGTNMGAPAYVEEFPKRLLGAAQGNLDPKAEPPRSLASFAAARPIPCILGVERAQQLPSLDMPPCASSRLENNTNKNKYRSNKTSKGK